MGTDRAIARPSSAAESGVTIVVATRDRRTELQRSLAHHEVPVIVVDNGSTDGSVDAVRCGFPAVEVIALGHNRGAPARNLGVERARTPYVAFADDDSWWAPGALSTAARHLDAHPRLALAAARILVGESEATDPVCELMRTAPLGVDPDMPGPSVLGFLACGAVVRRRAFLAVGGFDDLVFFCGEEERVALDLAAGGWGLAYVDDVVAHHRPSALRRPEARQALAARNGVLTACLRRSWAIVGRRALSAALGGPSSRAGLWAAVPLVPRALARRRRVPTQVEAAARRLGW